MEISSVSSSQAFFAPARMASSAFETQSSDQAMMNIDPDTFSSFVKEAGAEPEVRQDVVDSFKAKIASGDYPPQETVDGLANSIGGGVYQLAAKDFTSSN